MKKFVIALLFAAVRAETEEAAADPAEATAAPPPKFCFGADSIKD